MVQVLKKEWHQVTSISTLDVDQDLLGEIYPDDTEEELVQILAEFLLTSESHSVDAFDLWCRLDEGRPSSGTIRNQVGSWSSAKREALIALRDTWLLREG